MGIIVGDSVFVWICQEMALISEAIKNVATEAMKVGDRATKRRLAVSLDECLLHLGHMESMLHAINDENAEYSRRNH